MKIHCQFEQMLNPFELRDHPKNRNKHPKDQIQRLTELYMHHGIRHPIIVSKRSGFIVAGHGRKQAAIRAGMDLVPVVYQEFDSEEQEYQFMVSDNAISDWSELDLGAINADILDMGPDFDVDMMGIKDFEIELNDKELNQKSNSGPMVHKCPSCGHEFSSKDQFNG